MVTQIGDVPDIGIAVGNEVDLLIVNESFQVTVKTAFVVDGAEVQACLSADITNDPVPPHRRALVVTVECVKRTARHGLGLRCGER